jgi:hypothetical protein
MSGDNRYVAVKGREVAETWYVVIAGAADTKGHFGGPFETKKEADELAGKLNAHIV